MGMAARIKWPLVTRQNNGWVREGSAEAVGTLKTCSDKRLQVMQPFLQIKSRI
jgi:hypothetical protein